MASRYYQTNQHLPAPSNDISTILWCSGISYEKYQKLVAGRNTRSASRVLQQIAYLFEIPSPRYTYRYTPDGLFIYEEVEFCGQCFTSSVLRDSYTTNARDIGQSDAAKLALDTVLENPLLLLSSKWIAKEKIHGRTTPTIPARDE